MSTRVTTVTTRGKAWGIYRCKGCRAFSRMKLGICEHCGCRPRKIKVGTYK